MPQKYSLMCVLYTRSYTLLTQFKLKRLLLCLLTRKTYTSLARIPIPTTGTHIYPVENYSKRKCTLTVTYVHVSLSMQGLSG